MSPVNDQVAASAAPVVHDQISRPVSGLMRPTQNRESALSGRPRRKAVDNDLPATTSMTVANSANSTRGSVAITVDGRA